MPVDEPSAPAFDVAEPFGWPSFAAEPWPTFAFIAAAFALASVRLLIAITIAEVVLLFRRAPYRHQLELAASHP